ncbi:site-specific integrase [Vibrio metschnikovii]|uniref:Site-specific integrase n=3 Tax=Unclassified Bacteria TaxID=49928 RepID=A0AAU6UUF4_UNCXX|nr:site-specific integrase [Vibrio metschnikovii]EKO3597498.1 site-specific integrase [Vibrio metschnikovii]EKO3615249.1 site-specific integrase [Vibrio metschnikovii]EKO3622362.1 site-specific integrase [Vibrio metschnikovii]EKO3625528.1 site-specific integrase [Vibrio metschnikovii]
MSRKTRNIVKRELRDSDRVVFYSFLSNTTGRIIELEEHINSMIMSSLPYNTVKAKASDLAKFYDYFMEASVVMHSNEYANAINKNRVIAASHELRSTLTLIFQGYASFLLDGKQSKNPLARICAENLDSTPLARASVSRMISSLCDFVSASNALEHSLQQQRKLDGLLNVDQGLTAVGQQLGKVRHLSQRERMALIQNSYMASCISGGAKVTTIKNFFKLPPAPKSDDDKYFPLECVGQFLASIKSKRDRAIFALCFGGGLRISEAASIRFKDLDIVNWRVKLHDKTTISYLESVNYTNSSGKPVDHFSVHLIEPFKTFFFEELLRYLEDERPEMESEYVFLQGRGVKNKLTEELVYNPFYYSKESTISEAWKKYLVAAGLTDERFDKLGTHSMRHFYAVFLRNFAPRKNGSQGYSDDEVRYYMRHSTLKSTKIYAKETFEKMAQQIEETNKALTKHETAFYERGTANKFSMIENKGENL